MGFPQRSANVTEKNWVNENMDGITVDRPTLENIKDTVEGDLLAVSSAYYKDIEKRLPNHQKMSAGNAQRRISYILSITR